MKKTGFTLIEMLIVLSVSAMLTTMMIFYTRAGERQILLLREQAKLVSALLRAKSLAIQTYTTTASEICGYGVRFETTRYLIFKELCSNNDLQYTDASEDVEVIPLNSAIQFLNPTLTEVLFIPPDPQTILTPAQTTAVITIALTIDSAATVIVKVNNAGQITTQ